EALATDGIGSPGNVAVFLALALAESGAVEEAVSTLLPYISRGGYEGLSAEAFHGFVLYRGGRIQEADARMRARQSELGRFLLTTLPSCVPRSAAALERGEPTEALKVVESGLSRLAGLTNVAAALHLHRVRALSQLGRDSEARDALQNARDWLLAIRDTIEDPVYRT